MKWLLLTVFALFLFVHGSVLAQSKSAEQPAPDAEIAAESASADYGTLIDETGINFISTGALVIPSVPGAVALKGPSAGPEPRQPRPDAIFPPPEEAVP